MEDDEQSELLAFYRQSSLNDKRTSLVPQICDVNNVKKIKTLSIFFATLCVIDLFGVFPIIALPSTIISCGIYGLPIMLLIICIQIYTAVILGKCWTIAEKLDPSIIKKNRYPYAAIADFIYGKYMSIFVTILLDLTVFGGGIPNLIVASQNLELLGFRLSDGNVDFSFCYWLLILGLVFCPLMWLGSPKNMRILAITSVLVVISVALLIWSCIILDASFIKQSLNNKNGTTTTSDFDIYLDFPSSENFVKLFCIISFQFDIHPMLLTIQVDMENKKKIGNSVFYGILFTFTMSAITTILATHKYGLNTTPNLLEMLPKNWLLYMGILLVTLQLCLSSVVSNSALFQHIEDLLRIPRNFTYKRCIIRSLLVFLSITIAELIPHFDLVMSLIGGTFTGTLIFILPPLFYTKITQMEKKFDQEERLADSIQITEYEPFDDDFNMQNLPGQNPNNTNSVKLFIAKSLKILSVFIIPILVVFFGLTTTFFSTYNNLFDVSYLIQWNPCLKKGNFSFFSM